jgi:hypothetical protein
MEAITRFEIKGVLGEGTYSKLLSNCLGKIFKAYDRKLKIEVALKVEKNVKAKFILQHEYAILKHLQGKTKY